MFTLTWTQKIVIALILYCCGVATPLLLRLGPTVPLVETKDEMKDRSATRSVSKAVVTKKGTVSTDVTTKPDGTRHESTNTEFEVVSDGVVTTDTKNDKTTTTTIKIPTTAPLTRYSVGSIFWMDKVVTLSGGVRLGNLPLFAVGYVDLITIDPDFKGVEVKYKGFGLGLRVEL